MCRRRSLARVRTLLAVLLTLHPMGLASQSATAWRDSTIRLSRAMLAARDSLERRDTTLIESGRVNGLVISASPEVVGSAGRALIRFAALRARWYGDALPSPSGFRITLRTYSRWSLRSEAGASRSTVVLAGLPDSNGSFRVTLQVDRRTLGSPDLLAPRLLKEYGEALFTHGDSALRRWLGSGPSLEMAEAERRQEVMYDLVTGAGEAQRRCVRGDVAECAFALQLRALHAADPAQRYNAALRSDLYLAALETGGPGAWNRLTSVAGQSVEAQLAAAAGVPVDSLLRRWRAGILALKPESGVLGWRMAMIASGWCVLLALTALGVARWP